MIRFVIPAYNEASIIHESTMKLRAYLDDHFTDFTIHIVDNGSTDETPRIADELSSSHSSIHASFLDKAGKGRAIRHGWDDADEDVLGFIDADLSPSLNAIPPMVHQAANNALSVSTRHLPSSSYEWTVKRRIITKSYNMLLNIVARTGVSDHQCGLKTISNDAWNTLSDAVSSDEWFFDTELILHAHRKGIRIHEQALRWEDKPGSSVNVVDVSFNMITGLYRYCRRYGVPRGGSTIRHGRTEP